MSESLQIRKLTGTDLAFADSIRDAVGWNQTLADWKRFLAYQPDGCFVAEWEGAPAGTVTTTSYGKELAWIGMVIVHLDFRRRGIATALVKAAIEYLRDCGVRCIKLDATPDGVEVYERLGFQAEYDLSRWEGTLEALKKDYSDKVLSLPMDFDSEAFGVDRSDWLAALAKDAQTIRLVIDSNGKPSAYGMIRTGSRANYLGPICAADKATGRAVAESLLSSLEGFTFWDIPEANTTATELAESFGFKRLRHLLRMWMGDECIRGIPELQFALGDPGTG